MTFTVTLFDDGKAEFLGTRKLVQGNVTNTGGSTGGEVSTGLRIVEQFHFQPTNTTTATIANSVNETFPLSGGDVTLVTAGDVDGIWFAIGR